MSVALRCLTIATLLAAAGCTTNNFNCNVRDACRVPGAADHGAS